MRARWPGPLFVAGAPLAAGWPARRFLCRWLGDARGRGGRRGPRWRGRRSSAPGRRIVVRRGSGEICRRRRAIVRMGAKSGKDGAYQGPDDDGLASRITREFEALRRWQGQHPVAHRDLWDLSQQAGARRDSATRRAAGTAAPACHRPRTTHGAGPVDHGQARKARSEHPRETRGDRRGRGQFGSLTGEFGRAAAEEVGEVELDGGHCKEVGRSPSSVAPTAAPVTTTPSARPPPALSRSMTDIAGRKRQLQSARRSGLMVAWRHHQPR